jgi:hypothetical protein
MKMTPQELRDLADQIEEEGKIRKKGYLKFDLYKFESDHHGGMIFEKDWGPFWLSTKEEKEKTIEQFKNRFSLLLKEGTEFFCYIVDGKEEWYDENCEVECVDKVWADKYLRDIVEVI